MPLHPAVPMRSAVPAVLLLTALLGCDGLLDVDLPDRIEADALETPARAALLVNGAVADFECALAAYIPYTGMLGDEFMEGAPGDGIENRNAIRTGVANWTDGDCGEGILGLYIPVATARASTDRVLGLLEGWSGAEVADRARLLATAAVHAGYANLLVGEAFCEAAVDGGPAVRSDSLLRRAETRFTRAMETAATAGADTLHLLATLGRARARLGLRDYAAAAADAARIPEGFEWLVAYSTASDRTENHVFGFNPFGETPLGPRYRDVRVDGVPDPRIPTEDSGELDFTGTIPLWNQLKYASASDPIQLASWEEAQLIIAEAELEAGRAGAAAAIISTLRTRVGLPPFASTDPATVRDALIHERRAEMFLEGHHLGDFRRLEIPFDPPPGAETANGAVYGTVRCFPIPDIERQNNPNLS